MNAADAVVNIWRCEFQRSIRVKSVVIYTYLIALFMGGSGYFANAMLVSMVSDKASEQIVLPVADIALLPGDLEGFLSDYGIVLQNYPGELNQAVEQAWQGIGLVAVEGTSEQAGSYRFELINNVAADSLLGNLVAVFRIQGAFNDYLRLRAGHSESNNFKVAYRDISAAVATGRAMETMMLPTVMLLLMIVICAQTVLEFTGNEHQRKTLESLMVAPVEMWQVVLGKSLNVASNAVLPIFIAAAGYTASGFIMSTLSGAQFELMFVVNLLALILPLVLLYSVALVLVCLGEKTYLSCMSAASAVAIAMLICIALAYVYTPSAAFYYMVPGYGGLTLIEQLAGGSAVTTTQLSYAAGGNLLCAYMLVEYFGKKVFTDEKLLYGD